MNIIVPCEEHAFVLSTCWEGWCSDKTDKIYSGFARLIPRQGHRPFWVTFPLVFLRPSTKIPEEYLEQATADFFQTLQFIIHWSPTTIQRYEVWSSDSDKKQMTKNYLVDSLYLFPLSNHWKMKIERQVPWKPVPVLCPGVESARREADHPYI